MFGFSPSHGLQEDRFKETTVKKLQKEEEDGDDWMNKDYVLLVCILALTLCGCASSDSDKKPINLDIRLLSGENFSSVGIILFDQNGNQVSADGIISISVLRGRFPGGYDSIIEPVWDGKINVSKNGFHMQEFSEPLHGVFEELLMHSIPINLTNPKTGDAFKITATMYLERFGEAPFLSNQTMVVWGINSPTRLQF